MKYVIILLLCLAITGVFYGFHIKPIDPKNGDLYIGLSVVLGFLIVMPLFIYHRWKNRSVKDYMLTKENIEKMREYKNSGFRNSKKES
jgi:predicted membrane channel-forming protein YqfA (hemolysin III family)